MPSSFTKIAASVRINGAMYEIALLTWCPTTSKWDSFAKLTTRPKLCPSFSFSHFVTIPSRSLDPRTECLPGAAVPVRPPSFLPSFLLPSFLPSLHSFIQRLIINLRFIYGRPLILSERNKPSLTPEAAATLAASA